LEHGACASAIRRSRVSAVLKTSPADWQPLGMMLQILE
jgi:hypothetical protein